jgi:hypothetical protein
MARRTLAIIAEHLEQYETVYLATHDPRIGRDV